MKNIKLPSRVLSAIIIALLTLSSSLAQEAAYDYSSVEAELKSCLQQSGHSSGDIIGIAHSFDAVRPEARHSFAIVNFDLGNVGGVDGDRPYSYLLCYAREFNAVDERYEWRRGEGFFLSHTYGITFNYGHFIITALDEDNNPIILTAKDNDSDWTQAKWTRTKALPNLAKTGAHDLEKFQFSFSEAAIYHDCIVLDSIFLDSDSNPLITPGVVPGEVDNAGYISNAAENPADVSNPRVLQKRFIPVELTQANNGIGESYNTGYTPKVSESVNTFLLFPFKFSFTGYKSSVDFIAIGSEFFDPSNANASSSFVPVASDFAPVGSDFDPIGSDFAPVGSDFDPIGSDFVPVASDFVRIGSDNN